MKRLSFFLSFFLSIIINSCSLLGINKDVNLCISSEQFFCQAENSRIAINTEETYQFKIQVTGDYSYSQIIPVSGDDILNQKFPLVQIDKIPIGSKILVSVQITNNDEQVLLLAESKAFTIKNGENKLEIELTSVYVDNQYITLEALDDGIKINAKKTAENGSSYIVHVINMETNEEQFTSQVFHDFNNTNGETFIYKNVDANKRYKVWYQIQDASGNILYSFEQGSIVYSIGGSGEKNVRVIQKPSIDWEHYFITLNCTMDEEIDFSSMTGVFYSTLNQNGTSIDYSNAVYTFTDNTITITLTNFENTLNSFSKYEDLFISFDSTIWYTDEDITYSKKLVSRDTDYGKLVKSKTLNYGDIQVIQTDDYKLEITQEAATLTCTNANTSFTDLSTILLQDDVFKNVRAAKVPERVLDLSNISNTSFNSISSLYEEGSGYTSIFTDFSCVILPSITTEIGQAAFKNCTQLTEVKYKEGNLQITKVEKEAFYGCTSLQTFSSLSLSTMGSDAFTNCSSLYSFGSTYNALYTANTAYPYKNTENLNYFNFTEVTNGVSCVVSVDRTQKEITVLPIGLQDSNFITAIKNINTVSSQVQSVFALSGYSVILDLSSCSSLQTLVANKPSSNGSYSSYLNAYIQVVLPDGLTKIDTNTFTSCTKLKKINIPSSVTEIGTYAFNGCKNLEEAEFQDLTYSWTITVSGSSSTFKPTQDSKTNAEALIDSNNCKGKWEKKN